MFIKNLSDCPQFLAGDGSILRELLHPGKADINLRYSLAYAVVKPGQTSHPHRLKTSEVYYILEGRGIMSIDDETAEIHPHQAIYIPPMARQHVYNPGSTDLVFLCIVDPAWRKEDEEVL